MLSRMTESVLAIRLLIFDSYIIHTSIVMGLVDDSMRHERMHLRCELSNLKGSTYICHRQQNLEVVHDEVSWRSGTRGEPPRP